MKFGIWHDFRNPPEWPSRTTGSTARTSSRSRSRRSSATSRCGSPSTTSPRDGYLPSVFPLLAAIAMRTARVRIGSAIILGPFQHPIRFAEDVAFVDQLSGGRLEVGLGLGYRPREFELARRARRASGHAGPRRSSTTARRVWADGTVTPPPSSSPSRRSGSAGRARPRLAARRGSAARSCPTRSSRPR